MKRIEFGVETENELPTTEIKLGGHHRALRLYETFKKQLKENGFGIIEQNDIDTSFVFHKDNRFALMVMSDTYWLTFYHFSQNKNKLIRTKQSPSTHRMECTNIVKEAEFYLHMVDHYCEFNGYNHIESEEEFRTYFTNLKT